METKLYRGELWTQPHLGIHITELTQFEDLKKFFGGGDISNRDYELGDYVLHLSSNTPFSTIIVRLVDENDQVISMNKYPPGSYLVLKPDVFERNFKEVTHE